MRRHFISVRGKGLRNRFMTRGLGLALVYRIRAEVLRLRSRLGTVTTLFSRIYNG